MGATNTDLSLKLFVVLNRALAAVERHAEADASRHGLSMTEFGALEALYQKGDLLVGELQRKVLKSSGGITYVVDRLAEKGLVERKPCPGDRRAVYAAITAEGRALMDGIFPAHAGALTAAMGSLTRAEKRQAIDLLRALGTGAAAVPVPTAEEPAR
jgi:MarR family transcriptional regulator, 2-MHQ and catechol-resistance regulon repressor